MSEVERLRLGLTSMAYRGAALARHGGQVVFASYGIPGEEVEAEVLRRKKQYLLARVVQVLAPSPHRVEAPCPYFGDCGGCQWQHIDYPFQLELKRQVVREQLQRIGKLPDPPVAASLGMEHPWGYRNHVRFSADREGRLGFINPETLAFVPIARCLISHPEINAVLEGLQDKCRWQHQISVRYGVKTGDLLIHPALEIFDGSLESGQALYHEELLGQRFRISAASFFQPNTLQAERLAQVVLEGVGGGDTVVDAYAGVGTFARLLAGRFSRVIAIEESASAMADARVNLGGLEGVELLLGKVENALPRLAHQPEAAILDPPRTGCHPRALAALLELSPRRLVYVSCDPATLSRDLLTLAQGGYWLRQVQPVDMFPQTFHIECVAILDRGQG